MAIFARLTRQPLLLYDGAGQSRPFLFGVLKMFAIAYPALTYLYGPFPACVGMSRPRTELNPLVIAQTDCPAIIADTPEKMRALDDALRDTICPVVHFQNPDAIRVDPASWLKLGEVLHAARQTGCAIINAPALEDDAPHDDPTTALAGC